MPYYGGWEYTHTNFGGNADEIVEDEPTLASDRLRHGGGLRADLPGAPGPRGGEVSGCAYVDANENLVHDESEQLITGVPVRLERLDGGAWTEAARTETDLYGKYAFTGLSAGEYRVICTLSGQELYAVSVGTSMASEAGAVVGDAVTLEEGKSVSGGDVGLAPSAR